jgi:hypothetical protein
MVTGSENAAVANTKNAAAMSMAIHETKRYMRNTPSVV